MGEITPILIGLLVVLVIVVSVLARNSMRGKLVVRPLDEEDQVGRVKIRLTCDEATALSRELIEAADHAAIGRKGAVIEHYEGGRDDRLIRFEIKG